MKAPVFAAAVTTLAALIPFAVPVVWGSICLLYTSDAADERSSVDLGGRRIIKKTKPSYLTHATRLKLYRNHQ